MMRDPLDVNDELREFPGVAVSLAECGLRLWPHETEIVSIVAESHRDLGEAIETCRGFVIVPAAEADSHENGEGDGGSAVLARVIAQRHEDDRIVLVVRALCRAEVSNRYSLSGDRELVAARPRTDREPEVAVIHRDNRRREVLEGAAALIPGPLPIFVSSFLLDRVSLGTLCDLLAETAGGDGEIAREQDADLRSDAILAGLRREARLRRQSPRSPLSSSPFSSN